MRERETPEKERRRKKKNRREKEIRDIKALRQQTRNLLTPRPFFVAKKCLERMEAEEIEIGSQLFSSLFSEPEKEEKKRKKKNKEKEGSKEKERKRDRSKSFYARSRKSLETRVFPAFFRFIFQIFYGCKKLMAADC